MSRTSRPPVERRAVRALLLNGRDEILLLRIQSPEGDIFWIAPGGGIEAGEDAETALRRELLEELGLRDAVVGPVVWLRHHTFDWGDQRIAKHEEYRIVTAERFDPAMLDAAENEFVRGLRWWPVGELAAATERLTPLSLATIVGNYLEHGAPDPLPPVEVLVD